MDGFEYIKFDNVPITTPNGDNLIASINLEVIIFDFITMIIFDTLLDQTRNALHYNRPEWMR